MQSILYERPCLVHIRQLDALIDTLEHRRDLARLVKEVKVEVGMKDPSWRGKSSHSTVARKIRKLLQLAPDLRVLTIGEGIANSAVFCTMNTQLQHLRALHITTTSTWVFDLDDLSWTAACPNLTEMTIARWNRIDRCISPEGTKLPIKTLTISGADNSSTSILDLVARCPNVLHLHLIGTTSRLPKLAETLVRSKRLSVIAVNDPRVSLEGLLSLVKGRKALPYLETLDLTGRDVFSDARENAAFSRLVDACDRKGVRLHHSTRKELRERDPRTLDLSSEDEFEDEDEEEEGYGCASRWMVCQRNSSSPIYGHQLYED
ncbi:hypothetical protein JCM3766R1_003179 [Sporobolomyces carnicolor]